MKKRWTEPRWKHGWTAEEDAELVARFNAGQTATTIAVALGRSRMGVMRRRQWIAQGLEDYQPKRSWTPQEDATLIELLNAGQRPAAIAAALGRSISAVHTRTDVLRGYRRAELPPSRREVASDQVLPPILDRDPCRFLTAEDHAWMEYWRQPRAVRRAQAGGRGGEYRP
jgi:hypothetical protein